MASDFQILREEESAIEVDVVVKIGGALITDKSGVEALLPEKLERIADDIGQLIGTGARVVVVHGAGSFGHPQAAGPPNIARGHPRRVGDDSGGSSVVETLCDGRPRAAGTGPPPGQAAPPVALRSVDLRPGFSQTRAAVLRLNGLVVAALAARGLFPVAMSPFPMCRSDAGAGQWLDAVPGILRHGFVPVLHGDAVLDDRQACTILSGDALLTMLCGRLPVRRCVFVTDVPGLFSAWPPTLPSARLVPRIAVDVAASLDENMLRILGRGDGGQVAIGGEGSDEGPSTRKDTTGGMRGKVSNAVSVVLASRGRTSVSITGVGSRWWEIPFSKQTMEEEQETEEEGENGKEDGEEEEDGEERQQQVAARSSIGLGTVFEALRGPARCKL